MKSTWQYKNCGYVGEMGDFIILHPIHKMSSVTSTSTWTDRHRCLFFSSLIVATNVIMQAIKNDFKFLFLENNFSSFPSFLYHPLLIISLPTHVQTISYEQNHPVISTTKACNKKQSNCHFQHTHTKFRRFTILATSSPTPLPQTAQVYTKNIFHFIPLLTQYQNEY